MPALQPIEPLALGDRIYEAIRAAIIQNELLPGQKVSDRQLSDMLQVSRTPVREALHRLEGVGLVTARGRVGWVVAPLAEQDIKELFELRQVLEPVGLLKLESDPAEDVIERFATFFDGFEAEIPHERYEEYFARDHAFHKLLISCSHNSKIEAFYEIVESHIDRGRHFLSTRKEGRVDATLREHVAICEAIAARDFDAARSALAYHLRMGEELMVDFLRTRGAHG